MKRLLDDFAEMFNLDHPIRGTRLGDLVTQSLDRLDAYASPDWGSVGPPEHRQSGIGENTDFYYAPHLFPEMDPKLRLAHKLQFHMLPREVPPGAPLAIAAVLESYCHLSGDLFGWEMLAGGEFLIWILDVSGHGVRAGMASAMVKILIESLRRRGQVGFLVSELNELFVATLTDPSSNLFATGFFLSVTRDGRAAYTSAGHPPVFLRRLSGVVEELISVGMPVGMLPDRSYPVQSVQLNSGDMLLLYTDGVPEASNEQGELFGLERVRGLMRRGFETPRALSAALYENLAEYHDMERLQDDVTFVAARVS
jgi:serine phosphatase RsbU (regulator of sigma subunit)